jgi:hypothetical protein
MPDTEHPAEPDEEELEQVERHIQEARDAAERDGLIPDPDDDEPRFYDTGSIRPDLDDPEIAP